MYPIVPVNIPIVGLVDTLTVQVNSFHMRPGQVYPLQVYIDLRGPEAFYQMNLEIPTEIVEVWMDDQIILDYVVAQLEVELAPAEEPTEE